MYASHSKNINKNKSFHALSGKNQYIKAKKEKEEEERKALAEKRLAELASQKKAFAFDSMVRAADGGVSASGPVKFTTTTVDGTKRPRDDSDGTPAQSDGRDRDTRWMFKDDTHHATNATATSTSVADNTPAPTTTTTVQQEPAEAVDASSTTVMKGRITKEEAAKMQLDLDRAKKLKNDPLFKADQVEARLRGSGGAVTTATPTTTTTTSSAPLTSKQRMDAALAKLRKK